MLPRLLALFILVPLLDLAILVRIGQWLGFWPAMGLVLGTGMVGALLARSQGLGVLRGIRTEMSVGQIPSSRLLDGVLVLMGGLLLLAPGPITDAIGLVFLLPPGRRMVKRVLQRRLERMVRSGATGFSLIRR